MTTQERYERYNEVTFEAYIKAAIDYALARYRKQKARQAEKEVYLADLPEYWAARPSEELTAIDSGSDSATFEVDGISVDVHDPELIKALRFLVPQKRNILLLNIESFLDMVKKYTDPTELTPALLHELVEKL